MRTRRGRIIILILTLILTVLLEIATNKIINYNILTRIISAIIYFSLLTFIIIDAYWGILKNSLYNFYSTFQDICILGLSILLFYIFDGKENLPIFYVFFGTVILSFMTIIFFKLAQKHNLY